MTDDHYRNHLLNEIGKKKYLELYKRMYDLECLGCLVLRANRLMTNALNRRFKEAGHDITVEQFQILLHLWEKDGLVQSELVEGVKKDKASLARTLDIMEHKQNLILRIVAHNDRRQRQIHLTSKGKALKDVLAPLAIGQHMKYFAILGEENIETTRSSLKQVIEELKE